jgi:hypothetical protein
MLKNNVKIVIPLAYEIPKFKKQTINVIKGIACNNWKR